MTWGLTNPGRCPLCVAAGARHSLFIENEPTPPSQRVRADEFWDEDAKQHIHDPNRYKMHLRCSNGHFFNITHLTRCPSRACDWNKQDEVNGGTGWPEVPKVEGA